MTESSVPVEQRIPAFGSKQTPVTNDNESVIFERRLVSITFIIIICIGRNRFSMMEK